MRTYRHAQLIGFAALLTASVGCTHQDSPQQSEPDEHRTVDPRRAEKPYSLPIEKYALSLRQLEIINNAEYLIVKWCMAGFKLSYDRPPIETEAYPNANKRRYGLISLEGAMKFGYHVPTTTSERRKSPGSQERVVLLGSTDGKDKVNGKAVPRDGCIGQAKEKLRRKYQNQVGAEAAQQISTSSYQQSMRTGPVKLAFSRWAQCMKSEGFSYSSPIEALTKADLTTRKPTKSEIHIATTDVTCKNKTKLVQVWSSEEARIQNQVITKNNAALKGLQKSQQMMINEARVIIAERT